MKLLFRLLSSGKNSLFFFKRIRIGFTLFSGSLKLLLLNQKKFIFFITSLTLIQALRIIINYNIEPEVSLYTLITEFLSGQNFFELLLMRLKKPLFFALSPLTITKIILFYFEQLLIFFISLALTFYTNLILSNNFYALKPSLNLAFGKKRLLVNWTVLYLIIMYICAAMGWFGDILFFLWQLITSLTIQTIAFQNVTFWQMLKNTFKAFYYFLGNIVGVELSIEAMLTIMGAIFYYIYATRPVPTYSFLENLQSGHSFWLFAIYFLVSTIMVAETITLTKLYKLRE